MSNFQYSHYVPMVLERLRSRYAELGKDFYFKSPQLAKDMPVHSRAIGNALSIINEKTDFIILWRPRGNGKTALYLTNFKNNGDNK